MNIFIVGCGDIGIRCSRILLEAGHKVTGVRRRVAELPGWLQRRTADVADPQSLEFLSVEYIDIVIYIIAAASFNEHDYRAAYVSGVDNTLAAIRVNPHTPRRILFVSSTGVYHQDDDSMVDENSPVEPTGFNGKLMLQAEQLVRQSSIGTCVRFSGIYGPDRLRLINRIAAGQGGGASDAYTNRIHVEDCAGVLAHIVSMADAGVELQNTYLATDSCPATTADVEMFIAKTLGLAMDQQEPGSRSQRIAGSKRCSNQRLLDSGYQFIYPHYKAGYRQIIGGLRNG